MRKCSRWFVHMVAVSLTTAPIISRAQDATRSSLGSEGAASESEEIVVTATRLPIPEDTSPASITVVTAEEIEQRQIERVADGLREVPGLAVVQTGAPGQLTSVFTRGLRSEHTQVLLDGIPINQGLAGLFNFSDLTVDNIDRIEVVRGPQSTLYGPRALAGAIQIFTKRGNGDPTGSLTVEGGSFGTFRGAFASEGSYKRFDYSVGLSGLTTDNERPNNEYRLESGVANVGWSPNEQLRIGSLFTYSLADTGNPNTIGDPKPFDNFLTERWLIGPRVDFQPVEWWNHHLIVSYDHERQVNEPNQDGFVGPTRALFKRFTLDYQNDVTPVKWLTITTGAFYSHVDAGQERPFVSQEFGAQPTFISDETEQTSGFVQASVTLLTGLSLVAGGRYDHFNRFGDIWTYRFAGSYSIQKTGTTLHSSYATGFSPPSSQDKIFGMNFDLEAERNRGFDAGIEQRLWNGRVQFGATYFHNRLSNVIGFNGLFETLNLGAARTQGIEAELKLRPAPGLEFNASYTYLEAEKTSEADISQSQGARLPRRPRNEVYLSGSYLWFGKLRTTAEVKFVNAREELTFPPPDFLPRNIDVEDYAFINLLAEYEISARLSIFGRINNLTDEQYAEVFGFPALGRGAYVGARVSF
ncbi:MAG: TonB-dependent receptor [Chthoniobacterales bacterium]|nr:TonB-dependent receptor [Chthoniobacterales bacterium]